MVVGRYYQWWRCDNGEWLLLSNDDRLVPVKVVMTGYPYKYLIMVVVWY